MPNRPTNVHPILPHCSSYHHTTRSYIHTLGQLTVQTLDLLWSKWAIRGLARYVRKSRGLRNLEWTTFVCVLGFVRNKVLHQRRIFCVAPIDAVHLDIVDVFVEGNGPVLNPSRTVLVHAEEEDFSWALVGLTTYLEYVVVPGVRPLLRILVNEVQEQMMEKPNMSWVVRVETAICL